jgi:hypothetical protein
MKTFIAAAIAAFAIATPAQAAPQWIQVSADGTIFANYNTTRGTGRVRSVDVSMANTPYGVLIGTYHVDCPSWRWATTLENNTSSWKPIGKDTVAEGVAELVCPRTATVPVTSPAPATYGL